eukprot:TRINITY_DN4264_c0_g2_i6.p1 TRINITY_DN4264_c0_g2~~TRINITY_DN4264_c0_g2_i6.p1  ORF type:complete len:118 (+),score=29.57 TRINITY_DN4264_c0_g2_i6:39-392(+)
MYNGVGVLTPRGTGTNGHVMTNLSRLRPQKKRQDDWKSGVGEKQKPELPRANPEILEHERKRQIEILVTKWAEETGLLDVEELNDEQKERMSKARQRFEKEYSENEARKLEQKFVSQ